jgi:hypothetical protein
MDKEPLMTTTRPLAVLLTLVLLVTTGGALAETLWEWPYDIDNADNSLPGSYGAFYMADDFELTDTACVESVRVYGVYINGTPGSDYDVIILADDGGSPGAELTSEVCPPDSQMTGDTWGHFDYPVYQSDLILASPIQLAPGDYWLCVHYTGDRWYWMADETDGNAHRDSGSGWELMSGDYQLVFSVHGEWSGARVEETTWGRIKAF